MPKGAFSLRVVNARYGAQTDAVTRVRRRVLNIHEPTNQSVLAKLILS